MIDSTSQPKFLDEDKALACVHCGLCLGACPTYLETGDENDSPRGRIYLMRAMQSGALPVRGAASYHIDRCLGCRACETACPSGVEYGALLETTRDHIEKNVRRSASQRFLRRWMIEKVMPSPKRMNRALWAARLVKIIGFQGVLPAWQREAIALLPRRIRRFKNAQYYPAKGERRGTLGFIQGCVMSAMYGNTHKATLVLLNQLGYDVVVPESQVCCGALFAHGGQLNRAREAARRNIQAFADQEYESIIINAAGCGSTLKEYDRLLESDEAWEGRARAFASKVADITEFLARPEHFEALQGMIIPETRPGLVTYHDACHLAHAQQITQQPRELVRMIAGDQYVELPESDVCCGSAGSYNLTEPEMAKRLQKRKTLNILETRAVKVVTSNPGCQLQMEIGLKKAKANRVRVQHISDYLFEHLMPAFRK